MRMQVVELGENGAAVHDGGDHDHDVHDLVAGAEHVESARIPPLGELYTLTRKQAASADWLRCIR